MCTRPAALGAVPTPWIRDIGGYILVRASSGPLPYTHLIFLTILYGWHIIGIIYRWVSWGTGRFGNLPKITVLTVWRSQKRWFYLKFIGHWELWIQTNQGSTPGLRHRGDPMTTFPEGGEGLCEVVRERVCLLPEAAERNVLECRGKTGLPRSLMFSAQYSG